MRPNFTHTIRIAKSVFIYADGRTETLRGPVVRMMTLSNLVAIAAGSLLSVWWIDDYSFIGADSTHQYVIAYRLLNDETTVRREVFIELATGEED